MVYLNEEEIISDICNQLTDEALNTWLMVKREDLFQGHFNTGRAIRNEYRMWDKENPHTTPHVDGDYHPDRISIRIIEAVWDRAKLIAKDRGIPHPSETALQDEINRVQKLWKKLLNPNLH